MRFLIHTKGNTPPPMEQMPGLLDAMRQWVDSFREQQVMMWALAGLPGGGGIVDVESHEQLDRIMSGFPFGPYSDTQIYPIVDLDQSLAMFADMIAQMTQSRA